MEPNLVLIQSKYRDFINKNSFENVVRKSQLFRADIDMFTNIGPNHLLAGDISNP